MRRTSGGKHGSKPPGGTTLTKRVLIVGSLLVATLVIASVIFSRTGGTRVATTDATSATDMEKPMAPLPKALGARDTKPPGTVQNLRRTDTADENAPLAKPVANPR